jgi:thioredoxin reductase (NADPH)
MLDLAIVGSGPAALTAALYAARENLKVTVFEKAAFGGAAATISKIENFPGFSGSGAALMKKLRAQAASFGAEIKYGECTSIKRVQEKSGDPAHKYLSLTIDGAKIKTKSVLIATGSEPKTLALPTKKPVSYCATCDGALYKDKTLLVVGGGNSAVQEAFFLLKFAKHVTLINRSPLRASEVLKNKAHAEKRLKILENTDPATYVAEAESSGAAPYDAIFAFIGQRPATTFLDPSLLAEDGFVKTDDRYMTALPGLFAAGDVRHGAIKQALTAAAEGAAAALNIGKYLENL